MKIVDTLLQPTALLYAISQLIDKDAMHELYTTLINENYIKVFELINGLQERYTPDKIDDPSQILLPIYIHQFKKSILRDVKYIEELKFEKKAIDLDNVISIATAILDKHNISASAEIAEELYYQILQTPNRQPKKKRRSAKEVLESGIIRNAIKKKM